MFHFQLFLPATVLLIAAFAQPGFSQGTATAPSTVHLIDSGTGVVWIGGPNDTINGPGPIPIDLDVNGLPWRKALTSSGNGFFGGSILMRETIINSGTEPWTDWHEIDAKVGSHGTAWNSVTDVRINGTSILFNATVTGNTIDLDSFSQPALPGDVLEIDKQLDALTRNVVGPGVLVASILEYPTTIPEPSGMMLAVLAGGGLLCVRPRLVRNSKVRSESFLPAH